MFQPHFKYPILSGALVLSAIAATIFFVIQLEPSLRTHKKQIDVYLPDAQGLRVKNPVQIAGVEVGAIEAIDLDDGQAKLRVGIDSDLNLFSDASAYIRNKSLLGEKVLVLLPGSKEQPKLETNVIVSTKRSYDVDDLIQEASALLSTVRLWSRLITHDDGTLNVEQVSAFFAEEKAFVQKVLALLDKADKGFDDAKDGLRTLLENPQIKENLKNFEEISALLKTLLQKANEIDEMALREFLQLEGVRIRLFKENAVQKKVDALKGSKG